MNITDHDKAYLEFHQRLLLAFVEQIRALPPFNNEHACDDDITFLNNISELITTSGNEQLTQGQTLLCKIVVSYPHLMQLLPRDLLWFFGGDCLHYMPDEEIQRFQQLDEQREEAKAANIPFSYEKARMQNLGIH